MWSDYASPFCFLALPELERLEAEPGVRVAWHPFELRPDPDADRLYRAWDAAVAPMAAARGMVLVRPPAAPRSGRASEAAEFARDHGAFAAMHRGLFEAVFHHGRDIGLLPVVVDVGVGAGLDGAALRQALEDGRYAPRVLASRQGAAALGATTTPAVVATGPGGTHRLVGALPPGALGRAAAAARG